MPTYQPPRSANFADLNSAKVRISLVLIPGCIPCKLYAGDTPTLTIDSIVICQTHAGDLRTFEHGMHPGADSC
jgi:hypothetical protein